MEPLDKPPFADWPEMPDLPEPADATPPAEDRELSGEDLTPAMQAALDALLSEPFPQKPFSIVPAGSERNPEYTDYIIHKDLDTEHQCIFVFDSIVDAFAVAEEYKQATGQEAEPIEIDIFSLDEDRFWVKFYRANGMIAILSLPEYKRHMGFTRDY